MNIKTIPSTWDSLPLEITEQIFSYLPLPLVSILLKSENAALATVARRCYYSNIKLNISRPLDVDSFFRMENNALHMTPSDLEALANSDTLDQLRIKKLSISAWKGIKDCTFLHDEVFAKVSSIVTDATLEFDTQNDGAVFEWNCLPSSPSVQECIREISVKSRIINPNIPPLPSNLRKLELVRHNRSWPDDNAPPIQFPPNLHEFVLHNPWGPMSAYADFPSTLQKLELVGVKLFTIEDFNRLNLPNLKDLRLTDISGVTEINKSFNLPSSLENLDLQSSKFSSFEQRQLPSTLKKLSIIKCPLEVFRVSFPACLKELILDDTRLPSSQIRMLKFPPGLVYLSIKRGRLTSLDFVNSLPRSLESLHLGENSLGSLIRTDEGADVARPYKIKFPEGIHTLNLDQNRSLFTLYSSRNFAYPPGLTDLNLMQTNLSTAMGLENLPLLRVLNLGYNDMGSVDDLVIPPTLIRLYLSNNNLQRFSRILPDSITYLDLAYNKLKELKKFHLPVNCTHFMLSSNPLKKIQIANADNPDLKLQDFSLHKVEVAALRDISPLPQSLTSFSLTNSGVRSLSGARFPAGLKHLKLSGNKIASLENIELPQYLETLSLQENQITSLADFDLPDSLLSLEFGSNKLTSVDGIQLPPKLNVLNLKENAINTINELQLPDSLRELYLDKQEENPSRIRASIRTRFSEPPYASVKRGLTSVAGIPKLPSQLHSLILCKNGLCEQAIEHWTFPSGLKRLYMHDNVFVNYPMWRREVRSALPNVEFDGGRESSDDDFLMMDYSDDEMY